MVCTGFYVTILTAKRHCKTKTHPTARVPILTKAQKWRTTVWLVLSSQAIPLPLTCRLQILFTILASFIIACFLWSWPSELKPLVFWLGLYLVASTLIASSCIEFSSEEKRYFGASWSQTFLAATPATMRKKNTQVSNLNTICVKVSFLQSNRGLYHFFFFHQNVMEILSNSLTTKWSIFAQVRYPLLKGYYSMLSSTSAASTAIAVALHEFGSCAAKPGHRLCLRQMHEFPPKIDEDVVNQKSLVTVQIDRADSRSEDGQCMKHFLCRAWTTRATQWLYFVYRKLIFLKYILTK